MDWHREARSTRRLAIGASLVALAGAFGCGSSSSQGSADAGEPGTGGDATVLPDSASVPSDGGGPDSVSAPLADSGTPRDAGPLPRILASKPARVRRDSG